MGNNGEASSEEEGDDDSEDDGAKVNFLILSLISGSDYGDLIICQFVVIDMSKNVDLTG